MFLQIMSYVLSYDVWFYLSHRILHHPKWYALVHKEHHSVNYQTMTCWDTYVGHTMEGPFQSMGVLLPLVLFDFHLPSFLVSVTILNTRGMLRHDTRCCWIIGDHHILHHKYPKYNYGEKWLDYLGGTHLPPDEKTVGLDMDFFEEEWFIDMIDFLTNSMN